MYRREVSLVLVRAVPLVAGFEQSLRADDHQEAA